VKITLYFDEDAQDTDLIRALDFARRRRRWCMDGWNARAR
jgi:hypothetical protein